MHKLLLIFIVSVSTTTFINTCQHTKNWEQLPGTHTTPTVDDQSLLTQQIELLNAASKLSGSTAALPIAPLSPRALQRTVTKMLKTNTQQPQQFTLTEELPCP